MAPKTRKSASGSKKPGATPRPTSEPQPRPRADWEAIERDYRTGKFTDQELADRYGNIITRQAISKRAKVRAWQKDLTDAIRQATNAGLVAELSKKKVAEQVARGCAATVDAVVVAAETNKGVILAHRSDLTSARSVAVSLLDELSKAALLAQDEDALIDILAGKGAEPADLNRARQLVTKALSVNSRISSIKALAEAFTKLHDGERRAFNISDGQGDNPPADTFSEFLTGLSSRGSRLPASGGGAKA